MLLFSNRRVDMNGRAKIRAGLLEKDEANREENKAKWIFDEEVLKMGCYFISKLPHNQIKSELNPAYFYSIGQTKDCLQQSDEPQRR